MWPKGNRTSIVIGRRALSVGRESFATERKMRAYDRGTAQHAAVIRSGHSRLERVLYLMTKSSRAVFTKHFILPLGVLLTRAKTFDVGVFS